jgi:FKBP-type peptidyl-prolyl cis-trans isomerase FkpA
MHNNIKMRKLTTYTLALLGMMVLFNSCKKEYESIESIDDAKIQAYIKKNNLTMTKDAAGFYYQVVSAGTGAPLLNKDSVFYNLSVGSLAGTNYYATTEYSNEGTYLGYINPTPYRTALTGLNRGAKVKVILPSYLAYGKNGSGNIPSNEIILSEITTNNLATQTEIDDKRIADFLVAKGITATRHSSGVYYQVLTPSTGADVIDEHSTLVVAYTGRFLSGTVFDSNTAYTTTTLENILGWGKILPLFKAGAKIRIFIPSNLAYGVAGSTNSVTGAVVIPPSACLDFDITITSVTN